MKGRNLYFWKAVQSQRGIKIKEASTYYDKPPAELSTEVTYYPQKMASY